MNKVNKANMLIQQGITAQQSDDLAAAQKFFSKAVDCAPTYVHALHFYGLLLMNTGNSEQGLTMLKRASETRDADTQVLNNYGNALRENGYKDQAIKAYEKAVGLDKNNLNAVYNLGISYKNDSQLSNAVSQFLTLYKHDNNNTGVLYNLGVLHTGLHEYERAIDFLKPLSQLDDSDEVRLLLLDAHIKANEVETASIQARNILSGDTSNQDLINKAAALLANYGKNEFVEHCLLNRLNDGSLTNSNKQVLIESLINQGAGNRALELINNMLESDESTQLIHTKALVYKELGRYDEFFEVMAGLECKQGLTATMYNNYAMGYADIGDKANCTKLLKKALELDPHNAVAFYNYVQAVKLVSNDKLFAQMLSALEQPENQFDTERAVRLHFALAKAFADTSDYDQAFKHYKLGNELKSKFASFSVDAHPLWIDRIKQVFTSEFITNNTLDFDFDRELVFVVGVPRSGTSLLEQLLDAHSHIFGAGEVDIVPMIVNDSKKACNNNSVYPDSIASLDKAELQRFQQRYLDYVTSKTDSRIIIDKMPGNFHYIGLINILFPQAKIVNIFRHPLDVCLGNYFVLFQYGHEYSCKLEWLVRYYRGYRKLLKHWEKVSSIPIYNVHYENIVSDAQKEITQILSFLGLEWEDNCLLAHESDRPVRTASYWQVRQPIYTTALKRWQRYKDHIQVLIDGLENFLPEEALQEKIN